MNYLQKLHAATQTRFWVNNPTLDEARISIENDAFACTTNPAHCSKILQTDPRYMKGVVRKVLTSGVDLETAPERVYHLACKDLMDIFLPVYEKSAGQAGFVTVQEDPRREEDIDYIVAASLRAHAEGKNHMAKIPVTEFGLKAIEAMVAHNIPICATEVFSIAQAMAVMDVYQKSAEKSGNKPIMFVTHITGIMDQYFADLVNKENIAISGEALALAGTVIALKQYRLYKEKNIPCVMLGGGVRNLGHFTNFIGGDMHITINWSTAEELIDLDGAVENNIDKQIPAGIIDELNQNLPNFRRAYEEQGMGIHEFADYGPVMLFRTQFMNGFSRLVDEVRILAQK